MAADNVTAVLKQKQQRALSFATYGQAISLGPNDAVGFNTFPADRPIGPILRRKTAARLRRFFVWLLFAFLKIERLLRGFLQVVEVGDLAGFLALLTEDVTLIPDGGGGRGAAIQVLRGPQAVAQFMLGVRKLSPPGLQAEVVSLNGHPALLLTANGKAFVVICVYAVDGRIDLIQLIAGQKLAHLRFN